MLRERGQLWLNPRKRNKEWILLETEDTPLEKYIKQQNMNYNSKGGRYKYDSRATLLNVGYTLGPTMTETDEI